MMLMCCQLILRAISHRVRPSVRAKCLFIHLLILLVVNNERASAAELDQI